MLPSMAQTLLVGDSESNQRESLCRQPALSFSRRYDSLHDKLRRDRPRRTRAAKNPSRASVSQVNSCIDQCRRRWRVLLLCSDIDRSCLYANAFLRPSSTEEVEEVLAHHASDTGVAAASVAKFRRVRLDAPSRIAASRSGASRRTLRDLLLHF